MCSGCESALSGLVSGLVSLVSFIVFPILQISIATIKLVVEKIKFKY